LSKKSKPYLVTLDNGEHSWQHFPKSSIVFFFIYISWITISVSVVINSVIFYLSGIYTCLRSLIAKIYRQKKDHICSEEMSSYATSTNKRNLRRQRSNCAISFFLADKHSSQNFIKILDNLFLSLALLTSLAL